MKRIMLSLLVVSFSGISAASCFDTLEQLEAERAAVLEDERVLKRVETLHGSPIDHEEIFHRVLDQIYVPEKGYLFLRKTIAPKNREFRSGLSQFKQRKDTDKDAIWFLLKDKNEVKGLRLDGSIDVQLFFRYFDSECVIS